MYAFDLVRPDTLAGALEALQMDEAQPISGGQTLIPALKARLAMPSQLVSLSAIPELQGVCRMDDGTLAIGAATTHARVAREAAAIYPGLAALAGQIGDIAVRNRGTIGGSVANNDPSACYPAAVLASDATVVTDRRSIPASEYFQGMFATALDEGEIVTALHFPVPDAAAYVKFAQPASRFALVGAYVARFGGTVRVAITGASEEGVFRWTEAETALEAAFSKDALTDITLPEEGMIADVHGSAAYRAHLAGVVTRRAVDRIAAG